MLLHSQASIEPMRGRRQCRHIPVKIAITVGLLQAVANLLLWSVLLHRHRTFDTTHPLELSASSSRGTDDDHNDVHIAIVIPYRERDVSRIVDSIRRWHDVGDACSHKSGDLRVGLFFYSNLFQDAAKPILESHIQDMKTPSSALVLGCFSEIRTIYAELKPEEDGYPEGPSVMFFNLMLQERLRDDALVGYTHVMWMECDVRPTRPLWIDALVRSASVRGSDGFWVRGNHFHGKGMDFLTRKPEHDGWIGHINGNALYYLRDPEFHTFLRLVMEREPPTDYWRPFDVSMWRVLNDFPYSWRIYQAYRRKFQYTNVIQNVEKGSLVQNVAQATSPFLIHESQPLLQNSKYYEKFDAHGAPLTNRTLYGYELRPDLELSVLLGIVTKEELPNAVMQMRLARRFIPHALEFVMVLSFATTYDADNEIPSFIKVVFDDLKVGSESQRLREARILLNADSYCRGAHILYLESETAIFRTVYHKDIFLFKKPIVEFAQYVDVQQPKYAHGEMGLRRVMQANNVFEYGSSSRHVFPTKVFVEARDFLCERFNAPSLEAALRDAEDAESGAWFSAIDFLGDFTRSNYPQLASFVYTGAKHLDLVAERTPYSELNLPSPFCRLTSAHDTLDQLQPRERAREVYKILQRIEREGLRQCE